MEATAEELAEKTAKAQEKAIEGLLTKINEEMEKTWKDRDSDLAAKMTEQVRTILPAALKAYTEENPDFHLPGTEDSKEEFSIARAALAIANPTKIDQIGAGYEMECFKAMRVKFQEYVLKTTMDTGHIASPDALAGTHLVPEAHLDEFIDLLRDESVVFQSGARALPNQFGTITIPVLLSGASATWDYENATITPTDPTVGEHTMRPRRLTGAVRMSNMLITNSRPTAESIVRHDLMEQFRVALDTGILTEDGIGANPTGLLNATEAYTGEGDAGAVDMTNLSGSSGGWTYSIAMEFIADLANANALRGSLGWVMNPTDWINAIQMPSGTTNVDVARIVTQDGATTRLLGYPIRTTTILAHSNATGGEETVIFGDWSNIRVPFWRTLELAATNIGASTFLADQTVIRGIIYADISYDHLDAFSIGSTFGTLGV